MPDEVFQIGFETTGEEDAASAYVQIKNRQKEVSAEARKLKRELEQLDRAGQANTQEFSELSQRYVATRESASALGRQARALTREMRGQAAAGQAVQRQVAATTTTVEAGGRKWGELAGAVGNVGSVFGQSIPTFGRAGSVIGAIGTASSALTTALGPVGVALAAVTTGAGILIPLLQDTEDELDDVAESAVDAAASVRDLAAAFRERDEAQQLRSGVAVSEDEVTDAIQQQRDALAELESQRQRSLRAVEAELPIIGQTLDAFRDRVRESSELAVSGAAATAARALDGIEARIEQETIALEELLQAADRARNASGGFGRSTGVAIEGFDSERAQRQAEERDRGRRGRRGGGRGGRSDADAEREADQAARQRTLQEEIAMAQRLAESRDEFNAHALEAEGRWHQQRLELARESEDQQLALLNRTAERHNALLNERIEKEKAAARQQEERSRAMADTVGGTFESLGGNVTSLVGDMVGQVVQGEELSGEAFLAMLDAFLEATAVEYTIKALAEGANAVAAAARYDYAAAAQHGTAAALAIGVAAATGIGAAAIPNQSAPQSGSGQQPPQPGGVGAVNGFGGGNVTINLFAPNAVMTEAERGQLIGNGLRAARREFGASAVRF